MQNNNQSGFSMVEMLIVVVVVGIIAALSIPLYKKAINASENQSIFALTKILVQEQTSYFTHQSRYARLDELNKRFPIGTFNNNSIIRGKYTFTMSPTTPSDVELKENFTIITTRTIDNLELPYVISVDASGDVVQIIP